MNKEVGIRYSTSLTYTHGLNQSWITMYLNVYLIYIMAVFSNLFVIDIHTYWPEVLSNLLLINIPISQSTLITYTLYYILHVYYIYSVYTELFAIEHRYVCVISLIYFTAKKPLTYPLPATYVPTSHWHLSLYIVQINGHIVII